MDKTDDHGFIRLNMVSDCAILYPDGTLHRVGKWTVRWQVDVLRWETWSGKD